MDTEATLTMLRKNVPVTLSNKLFDLIETKEVVNQTFINNDIKRDICYNSVNGVIREG